jgi:hypothetical protein
MQDNAQQAWDATTSTRIQRVSLTLALALALAWPQISLATEAGASHYLPGGTATLIDLAPTKPGWVAESIYLHYEGKASTAVSIPIAGTVGIGMEAKSDALLLGAFYTFEQTVLGARYSAGAFLPYVWMDVEASIDTPLGTLRRRDSESGVGDLTLIPAMLAWKSGSWQYNALLPVYAPTGEYETGRLANTGLNYWTFDPTVGVSYNNATSGFNAALHGGLSFNTENPDTDYRSGTTLHLDASVQQLLPLGPGFMAIGAEAFYLEQVSGDSGTGARFGDFEGRTLGIGPVLSYILPRGKETLVAELRWLPETDVKNRLEGDYVWAKLVYQF